MKIPFRLKTLSSTSIQYIHIGVVLLLGIASYANSLNVSMQYDDETAVHVTPDFSAELYSIQGFLRSSRWFTDITFAMNRHLHGILVQGYHLFNLAIHLSSAIVIYLLVRRAIQALKLTFHINEDGDGDPFLQRFIPFVTAALFVCHPVQTQAVTYIVQRYTSLATLLYLSSLLAYLLARLAFTEGAKKLHVWSWGFACIVLAAMAMKSKEIAFTLPLMIVALEFALFRGHLLKNRLFLALGTGLLLIIPLQLFFGLSVKKPGTLFGYLGQATAETDTISRIDYLLTQFKVVATYLRLLVLPINQNLDYDYPVSHSLLEPEVFSALALHIALAAAALFLFSRSQRHVAPPPHTHTQPTSPCDSQVSAFSGSILPCA